MPDPRSMIDGRTGISLLLAIAFASALYIQAQHNRTVEEISEMHLPAHLARIDARLAIIESAVTGGRFRQGELDQTFSTQPAIEMPPLKPSTAPHRTAVVPQQSE